MADPNTPGDLRYSKEHEWVRIEADEAVIGITYFAQDQLGDVVFIDLPEAGAQLTQFQKFGEVESVKSVSDLFAPVSGEVTARNDAIIEQPENVNRDPYGDGWLLRIRLSDTSELDNLLDAEAYQRLTTEGGA